MSNRSSERALHPASFLFELASHVRQLVLPGLFVLVAGARGSESWQIYGMLLVVPLALVSIARVLVFSYRFAPDELVIRSGLIVKQQRHIPFARVQNVDAVQSIFHRALGVVDVRLETAGGEEPEAHLKVVTVAAFDELRARVHAGRQAREPVPVDAAAALPAPLLALSPAELIRCGLIQGRGLIVVGALFGLIWEAGLMDWMTTGLFGEAMQGRGVGRQMVRTLTGRGMARPQEVLLVLAGLASLVVVTRLFSVGWALVRLHGFTLRRIGDDLRTDFGLLTRVSATIPIRRIQSVTVHDGPLHRWFGRVSIHVDTAGGSGAAVQLQRQWLAPVIGLGEVDGLLRQFLPAAAFGQVDWQAVDARGVRRERVHWLVAASLISLALVVALGWWTVVPFALLLAVGEMDARRSVRALGWSLSETALFFRSGWLVRRRSVAPFAKIQAVSVHQSPFDRRLSLVRIHADTAGSSPQRHRIHVPYLAEAIGRSVAARLSSEAARTTFRW